MEVTVKHLDSKMGWEIVEEEWPVSVSCPPSTSSFALIGFRSANSFRSGPAMKAFSPIPVIMTNFASGSS